MNADCAGAPIKRRLWPSPEIDRLDSAIRDTAIALMHCVEDAQGQDWCQIALQHLKQAQEYLAARNIQQSWVSLQAARRAMLLNPAAPEGLELAAIELRREARKVSGWRAKAIEDLICDAQGELRTDLFAGSSRMRVISALALRDDQFNTDYFKISLRRRHLFRLFLALLAGIAATLLLSWLDFLPPPFNEAKLMAGVVLFGVLGATLSIARGLLTADISAKIPAQQIGSFVIWMRPAIGAAAALISFVFLNAKAIRVFEWEPTSPTIIFMVATVSGFSERFIVGAIERIANGNETSDKDNKRGAGKDKERNKEKDRASNAEGARP